MVSVVDVTWPAMALRKENSTQVYLRLEALESVPLNMLENSRYYTVIWIQEGSCRVKHDFREHAVAESCMLFFSPHQPYGLFEARRLSGIVLQFASDFYCIERHRHETLCSGVLFNNVLEDPLITVDRQTDAELRLIIGKMQEELNHYQDNADPVLLQSLLKIFLIQAVRAKRSQSHLSGDANSSLDQAAIQKLTALIESRFRDLKKPSDYAALLNISVSALGKLARKHFHRSLTHLIQERIVLEAKRNLVLTDKSVKTIAYELGYHDEYYFSRLFRRLTGLSPTEYRKSYLWIE